MGIKTAQQIADELGRTLTSVKNKMSELGLSQNQFKRELRNGTHGNSVMHHPEFSYLLRVIQQPKLKRYGWTAFDTFRFLLLFGAVEDQILAKGLGRTASAVYSKRLPENWTMGKAKALREMFLEDEQMRLELRKLKPTGERQLPELLQLAVDLIQEDAWK